MSDQERFSELLKQLLDRFGPSLSFSDAATRVLRFPTSRAAYQARRRGKFPVRVDDVSGRLIVSAFSLAAFQMDGKPQHDQVSAPQKKKSGRPTNAEQTRRLLIAGGEQ